MEGGLTFFFVFSYSFFLRGEAELFLIFNRTAKNPQPFG
jgi:hypothetical protein